MNKNPKTHIANKNTKNVPKPEDVSSNGAKTTETGTRSNNPNPEKKVETSSNINSKTKPNDITKAIFSTSNNRGNFRGGGVRPNQGRNFNFPANPSTQENKNPSPQARPSSKDFPEMGGIKTTTVIPKQTSLDYSKVTANLSTQPKPANPNKNENLPPKKQNDSGNNKQDAILFGTFKKDSDKDSTAAVKILPISKSGSGSSQVSKSKTPTDKPSEGNNQNLPESANKINIILQSNQFTHNYQPQIGKVNYQATQFRPPAQYSYDNNWNQSQQNYQVRPPSTNIDKADPIKPQLNQPIVRPINTPQQTYPNYSPQHPPNYNNQGNYQQAGGYSYYPGTDSTPTIYNPYFVNQGQYYNQVESSYYSQPSYGYTPPNNNGVNAVPALPASQTKPDSSIFTQPKPRAVIVLKNPNTGEVIKLPENKKIAKVEPVAEEKKEVDKASDIGLETKDEVKSIDTTKDTKSIIEDNCQDTDTSEDNEECILQDQLQMSPGKMSRQDTETKEAKDNDCYIPTDVGYFKQIDYPVNCKGPEFKSDKFEYNIEFLVQFKNVEFIPKLFESFDVSVLKAESNNFDRRGGSSFNRILSRPAMDFGKKTSQQRFNDSIRSPLGPPSASNPLPKRNAFGSRKQSSKHHQNVEPLVLGKDRWVPKSLDKNVKEETDLPLELKKKKEIEDLNRKVKGLLNKLAIQNFDSLTDKILVINNKPPEDSVIEHNQYTQCTLQLIFDKATDEPTFSTLYADLCTKLQNSLLSTIKDDKIKNSNGEFIFGGALFRKYLLTKCQEEFEKGWNAGDLLKTNKTSDKQQDLDLKSDEYYAAAKAKRRGLGLVKFVGELFKNNMITERVMHGIIKTSLGIKDMSKILKPEKELINPEVEELNELEDEEIESLAKLFTTIGFRLDNGDLPDKVIHLETYYFKFEQLARFETDIKTRHNFDPRYPTFGTHLNSRIKFMLKDLIDLRINKWNPNMPPPTRKVITKNINRTFSNKGSDGWSVVGVSPSGSNDSRLKKDYRSSTLSTNDKKSRPKNPFHALSSDTKIPVKEAPIIKKPEKISEKEIQKSVSEILKDFWKVLGVDELFYQLNKKCESTPEFGAAFFKLLFDQSIEKRMEDSQIPAQILTKILEAKNEKLKADYLDCLIKFCYYLSDWISDVPNAYLIVCNWIAPFNFDYDQFNTFLFKSILDDNYKNKLEINNMEKIKEVFEELDDWPYRFIKCFISQNERDKNVDFTWFITPLNFEFSKLSKLFSKNNINTFNPLYDEIEKMGELSMEESVQWILDKVEIKKDKNIHPLILVLLVALIDKHKLTDNQSFISILDLLDKSSIGAKILKHKLDDKVSKLLF